MASITPRRMIDPGARDQQIEIKISEMVKSASGALSKEAVSSQSAWANVREVKAQTDREDGMLLSSGIAVFVIRYRRDLKESDVIVWRGVEFSDLSFASIGHRNELLEITGKRRKGKNNGS